MPSVTEDMDDSDDPGQLWTDKVRSLDIRVTLDQYQSGLVHHPCSKAPEVTHREAFQGNLECPQKPAADSASIFSTLANVSSVGSAASDLSQLELPFQSYSGAPHDVSQSNLGVPQKPAAIAAPPNRWMSVLPDHTLVSSLTIPGTHDSCARLQLPYVQTQTLSITDQLSVLGVRALDLRLRRDPSEGDRLYCYHGGVPLGTGPFLGSRLPLDDVMAEIWRFLERGGETVLLLIDNDDAGDSRDPQGRQAFYRAVANYIVDTPDWDDKNGNRATPAVDGAARPQRSPSGSRWFTEPWPPRLGEVRGRAVLLRRYALPHDVPGPPVVPLGIDLSSWVNDSPDFTIVNSYVRVTVQDKWLYPRSVSLQDLIASKSSHVQNIMKRAAAVAADPSGRTRRAWQEEPWDIYDDKVFWYINFCSAVGERFQYGELADPKSVAGGAFVGLRRKWLDGVNLLTAEFIARSLPETTTGNKPSLGIVYMDFPELPSGNGLVRQLIEANF